MLVRHSSSQIPRCFREHPAGGDIVAEADIGVTKRAKLRAKLLVFKNQTALRKFWRDALGRGHLGRGCLGAVNALSCEIWQTKDGKESKFIEVDPRYFCVIGLVLGHLTMEIISHESMHAGFAYAKRHAGDFWCDVHELDEENVCYPAGRIAAAINRFLYDKWLYSK